MGGAVGGADEEAGEGGAAGLGSEVEGCAGEGGEAGEEGGEGYGWVEVGAGYWGLGWSVCGFQEEMGGGSRRMSGNVSFGWSRFLFMPWIDR